MLISTLIALPLFLGAPLAPQPPISQEPAAFSDEQVLKAWEALEGPVQEEVVEWFRSEVVWLNTFQNSLLRFALKDQEKDPGMWPVRPPLEFFDPATHAPAQPIPRKELPATSSKLAKKRKEFSARVPDRKLDSAWVYDYATRELQRVARLNDPDRIFRNALNGFPPDLDLAEALLEMELDDGSQQKAAIAFNRAYTDRLGNVYTGLSLYDAWASGSTMEMPDIDTLGIVHELENDWKSFKAPVPGGKQKKLYDRVGKLFEPLHHHRGLRHALALNFFSGYPVLRDGYSANNLRFHALWDDRESTPEKMIKKLPKTKKWESFLKSWIKKVDRSKKLTAAGTKRRDTLHNDGLWVRQKLIDIMVQGGFLGDQ